MPSLDTHDTPSKAYVALSALLCVGLLAVGVGAATASFVPYRFFLARAQGLKEGGQLSLFTHEFYQAMQLRLRWIAAVNVAAGFLVFLFRKPVRDFITLVFSDCRSFSRDIKLAIKSSPAVDDLTLACLLIIAFLLRFSVLFQPMREDEAYSFLQYSSRPFYSALSLYNAPSNHLLHTLLVRVAYLLFGDHPWALRLPVLVAGLCLVPGVYFAARSLYRNSGALLAAALVASSSILIEYSTNARGYIILVSLFMSLIPVAAYLSRKQNWAAWVTFAILGALGAYTIPIMLYPFGGICLWLLLSAKFEAEGRSAGNLVKELFVTCGLAGFLVFELYSPVLAVSGPAALFANKWVRAKPVQVFLTGLPPSLGSTWSQWNRDLPLWLKGLLLGGFVVSLLWTRRQSLFRVPLPLALALWVVPLVFIQRVDPFERVWLFALPLYLMAASGGVAAVLEPWFEKLKVRPAMAILAIAVAIFAGLEVRQDQSIYATNDGRGLEALAYYLKGRLGPGDSVIAGFSSDPQLQYYFREAGLRPSYVNGPHRTRMLVVVNGVVGETVAQVLSMAQLSDYQNRPARLLIRFDTASLYELAPAGGASKPTP